MSVLVLSDIHANLTALEAVLADAASFDEVWCLGDVVGYGPDPNDCVERIRELPNLTCLRGNHDSAVTGQTEKSKFNPSAQEALRWTESELLARHLTFLKGLPTRTEQGEVTLAHGSPRDPVWEYIMDTYSARINFKFFETALCLVGHSHVPFFFSRSNSSEATLQEYVEPGKVMDLPEKGLMNPGSVGQPRDNDPRAAYALLDLENRTWTLKRVAYDIEAVQARMREADLPATYIRRIVHGW